MKAAENSSFISSVCDGWRQGRCHIIYIHIYLYLLYGKELPVLTDKYYHMAMLKIEVIVVYRYYIRLVYVISD